MAGTYLVPNCELMTPKRVLFIQCDLQSIWFSDINIDICLYIYGRM